MSLYTELDRIAESIRGPLTTGPTAAAEARQSNGNEALMEAFRQVGLSERDAREGVRGLASGDYFGFEDALVVLDGFDNASVVDWTRAREVVRRFGRTILAERRTAPPPRSRVIESASTFQAAARATASPSKAGVLP